MNITEIDNNSDISEKTIGSVVSKSIDLIREAYLREKGSESGQIIDVFHFYPTDNEPEKEPENATDLPENLGART